jgi:hypothetical protein
MVSFESRSQSMRSCSASSRICRVRRDSLASDGRSETILAAQSRRRHSFASAARTLLRYARLRSAVCASGTPTRGIIYVPGGVHISHLI